MRTTLKRGYGRTSAANGNGRASLPPDALSAVSLYQQPEAPPAGNLRRVGRVLGWLALALVVVAAGLGGGIYLWWHESVAAVQARSTDLINSRTDLDIPLPHHAATALVIGYDHRAGEGNAPSRSDTLMLLRADPQTKTVSMLSFPRDLAVEIHCPGRPVFTDKINAAYSYCKAPGSLKTIKALTGVPINYLIAVNFRGFKKVVNTLGGVWVDIDRRYFNDRGGPYGYATINIRPGYQRLTGGAALDFVRFRHTDSDIYRTARQQLFVQAMKEQFKRSFSFTQIPKLVGAITNNVEVAARGKTVSGETILKYALLAYELPPGHFFQAKIDGLTGYTDLTADSTNMMQAVREFSNPDVSSVKTANDVALGRKIKRKIPKPGQTSILVLNGNNVEGSAATAKYLLGQRGYGMLDTAGGRPANAPTFDYFHTKVYYRPSNPSGKATARSVANLFGAADVAPMTVGIDALSNGAMLAVVTGTTFHNSLIPPPPVVEIKRLPPNVLRDRSATESLVRTAQRDVPFSLQVPSVIERSSVADPELPMRVYQIDGDHKAVRLVFRKGGANEYWGIEETNWDGAPVLDERNFHRVLRGRPYDLYYHGKHLHMVVLKANGASYWVVNTLLDSLSNETMLAIAKGLEPFAKPKVKEKPAQPRKK